MWIEYLGGPADGKLEPAPPGPLPDRVVVARKRPVRYSIESGPTLPPVDYSYDFTTVDGDRAVYTFDPRTA